ncbi:MAG TPA: Ig domain-containing protein, partial [Polyangiaceae bacterium]|nr:Ig domain-containing protein [Polyangiaceae bacterium]
RDSIVYSCSGLPKGAELDETSGRITYEPTRSDVGEHPITVFASDGELTSRARYVMTVSDPALERDNEELNEWESYLQPGLGYHFYLPADQDNYAPFHGIDIQLSIVSFVHRNNNRGPSHGRFYLSARILHSTSKHLGPLFSYAAGMTLSMERNPKRSWLIPHYGLEVGGMTQPQMGGKFQSFLFGGVHVYASRNLFVNLAAGYLLVPSDMDDLAGFTAGANAEFSLW